MQPAAFLYSQRKQASHCVYGALILSSCSTTAPRVRINYYTSRPFCSGGNTKAGEHVVLIAFIPCVINHRMATL